MAKMPDTPVYTAEQTHRSSAPSKSTPYRTTYTGPVKNRGEDAQGRAKVSREELADFRRKYGADKTLRDLLNADKTGKLPASEKSPLARGPQGANIEPSRVSMSPARREAMDRASENARKREESKKAVMDRQEAAASRGMERLKSAGLTPGSTTLGQSLGAAATMAAPSAAKPLAKMAGRAITGAMERRAAAEGAKRTAKEEARKEPALSGELPKVGGVFRSARQPPPPKPRIKVEGSTSGKYQSARDVEARRAGRKAEEDYVRDVMERGAEMGMKRGGMAKAYAKGGSVKGGGCETRSKKTRFI